jgi:hypothetical protein
MRLDRRHLSLTASLSVVTITSGLAISLLLQSCMQAYYSTPQLGSAHTQRHGEAPGMGGNVLLRLYSVVPESIRLFRHAQHSPSTPDQPILLHPHNKAGSQQACTCRAGSSSCVAAGRIWRCSCVRACSTSITFARTLRGAGWYVSRLCEQAPVHVFIGAHLGLVYAVSRELMHVWLSHLRKQSRKSLVVMSFRIGS